MNKKRTKTPNKTDKRRKSIDRDEVEEAINFESDQDLTSDEDFDPNEYASINFSNESSSASDEDEEDEEAITTKVNKKVSKIISKLVTKVKNQDNYYGRDDTEWQKKPPASAKTPSRNIIRFKPGPVGVAKEAKTITQSFNLFLMILLLKR